ncbi:uncharacterized protein LOC100378896 [Saccoglossus kowalevskii]|uniref:Signal peptide, CUB and EGF-like domain-containing protein 2-like n=1 Tax=Saccoglossus kowalevskii TaxID=10224 RepID=A0ABM0GIR8_SACKO|nr:PREDICTED: signal peptide, CUB and EGF-like domain-containing protein 2-like [Saccoglossus kowalevskii]
MDVFEIMLKTAVVVVAVLNLVHTSCDTYGCEHLCVDVANDSVCSCNSGYALDNDGLHCNDVDECLHGTSGCSQVCINTIGGAECECYAGYQPHPNRRFSHLCVDLDECSIDNGGCSHNCTNTEGSYNCSCVDGFILWEDDHSCDIDECVIQNGGCFDLCINHLGTFECTCQDGYYFTNDGVSCEEITVSPATENSTLPSQEASTSSQDIMSLVSIAMAVIVIVGLLIGLSFTLAWYLKKKTSVEFGSAYRRLLNSMAELFVYSVMNKEF